MAIALLPSFKQINSYFLIRSEKIKNFLSAVIRSVPRIVALLTSASFYFKFTFAIYPEREVPSACYALTGVSASRCLDCTEPAHSFILPLPNLYPVISAIPYADPHAILKKTRYHRSDKVRISPTAKFFNT